MLSPLSGNATMYLMWNSHLRSILADTRPMVTSRNMTMAYRGRPIRATTSRIAVRPSNSGMPRKHAAITMRPGISRTRQPIPPNDSVAGGGCLRRRSQKISDRLTLVPMAVLCGSHGSKGPKKLQFGPRRNVPITIGRIQRTRKPNMNTAIANGRSRRV